MGLENCLPHYMYAVYQYVYFELLLCEYQVINPLPVRLKVLLRALTGCVFSVAFKFTDYTSSRSPLQEKKIITIKLKKTE
jgi:hypothetical protein